MRKLTRYVAPALLLTLGVFVAAQTQHITAFTGTWKYNAAKSTFNPGPPFKSFTLTFTPGGVRHLDLVGANGQTLKAALPWSDGRDVAGNYQTWPAFPLSFRQICSLLAKVYSGWRPLPRPCNILNSVACIIL